MLFIDWLYEREFTEADDQVSLAMASLWNRSLYATIADPYKLKLDGGNFFTDGAGLAISSTRVAA